jgi:hypothetical protein
VAEGSVGGSDSTISISETSITETSITKTSISKTVISKSMISKTIWVSISSIKDSSFSIGISLSFSFTFLATTWDRGSEVVGADTDIGGVGQTEGSSSNSMSKSGMSKTSISKTSITKTVISGISKSIRVSISTIKGISLRLSLGLTLLTSIKTMGIWVASIGQRSSGTGDRHVSSVHTGGRLATESIGTIGIGMAEAISITSIQESRVGLCFSVHGGDEGRCNN